MWTMIESRLRPFAIEKRFKALSVLFNQPLRLRWQLATCSRKVIKRNGFERRSGGQAKHSVSSDQQSCLPKSVLALQMHGALDDSSPMEHTTSFDPGLFTEIGRIGCVRLKSL